MRGIVGGLERGSPGQSVNEAELSIAEASDRVLRDRLNWKSWLAGTTRNMNDWSPPNLSACTNWKTRRLVSRVVIFVDGTRSEARLL